MWIAKDNWGAGSTGSDPAPKLGESMDLAQHRGAVDPEGIMVLPYGYGWLEEQIQRLDPALMLAFDRSIGRYVVIRTDHELRRMSYEPGAHLWYRRPFWTVILDCKRWLRVRRKKGPGGWRIRTLPRMPGQWIVEQLATMHRSQLTHDNTTWASKKIQEVGEARQAAAEKQAEETAEAITEDWLSVVDPADPVRFKPSALVPEKGF